MNFTELYGELYGPVGNPGVFDAGTVLTILADLTILIVFILADLAFLIDILVLEIKPYPPDFVPFH